MEKYRYKFSDLYTGEAFGLDMATLQASASVELECLDVLLSRMGGSYFHWANVSRYPDGRYSVSMKLLDAFDIPRNYIKEHAQSWGDVKRIIREHASKCGAVIE